MRQGLLCSSDCPATRSIDQAGRKLKDPSASASEVLGLKACAIMPCIFYLLICLLETGSHYIALAVLRLPCAGIKGVAPPCLPVLDLFLMAHRLLFILHLEVGWNKWGNMEGGNDRHNAAAPD